MSSNMKFISNSLGNGDWCLVVLDGEVLYEGHELSFFDAYELMNCYGRIPEIFEYIKLDDEQIQNWRNFV